MFIHKNTLISSWNPPASTIMSHHFSIWLLLDGKRHRIPKTPSFKEVEAHTIFKIANFISIYWLPVLVPIGLVDNTLSFLVMIKPNNKKMSTCIYMVAISINDNIMMCMSSHEYLVSVMQIHKWNSIECRISGFVTLFALQNCTFQVVAMTLDKYIAIKWPHRAATYSTPKRAKLIVVTLYVVYVSIIFPIFFLQVSLVDLVSTSASVV